MGGGGGGGGGLQILLIAKCYMETRDLETTIEWS